MNIKDIRRTTTLKKLSDENGRVYKKILFAGNGDAKKDFKCEIKFTEKDSGIRWVFVGCSEFPNEAIDISKRLFRSYYESLVIVSLDHLE